MSPRKEIIFQKVMARVFKCEESGCWDWTGPTSGDGRGGGYGRMWLEGTTVAPHRVIFTHFHGFLPAKMQVDHKCRNRLCVNPEHLEAVTHKENQKRRAIAMRQIRESDSIQQASA